MNTFKHQGNVGGPEVIDHAKGAMHQHTQTHTHPAISHLQV